MTTENRLILNALKCLIEAGRKVSGLFSARQFAGSHVKLKIVTSANLKSVFRRRAIYLTADTWHKSGYFLFSI